MPRSALLGICFAVGTMVGVLGTALHGNIWLIGEPESGLVLPWGSALSLLILFLLLLWAGTTGRSLVEVMLAGGMAFTVATAAYIWPGPDQLVVPYSSVTMQHLPGPVIASLVWWIGSALVTIMAMLVVKWILLRDDYQQRQAQQAGAEWSSEATTHQWVPGQPDQEGHWNQAGQWSQAAQTWQADPSHQTGPPWRPKAQDSTQPGEEQSSWQSTGSER